MDSSRISCGVDENRFLMEAKLWKHCRNFSSKPALETAKIYHALTTGRLDVQSSVEIILSWCEMVSDLDTSDVHSDDDVIVPVNSCIKESNPIFDLKFDDVCAFLRCISREQNIHEALFKYQYLRAVRRNTPLPTDLHQNFLQQKRTAPMSADEIVVSLFASFFVDDSNGIQNFLSQGLLTDDELFSHVSSLLCSCGTVAVETIKQELISGRINGQLTCTCNTSGLSNLAFSSNSIKNLLKIISSSVDDLTDQETSFTQKSSVFHICPLHRLISHLDDILHDLELIDVDTSPIIRRHLRAGRSYSALNLLINNENALPKTLFSELSKTNLEELRYVCRRTLKLQMIIFEALINDHRSSPNIQSYARTMLKYASLLEKLLPLTREDNLLIQKTRSLLLDMMVKCKGRKL